MIFATGDTHGNFQRFKSEYFPEQANMTRSDYVIICGDFGGVWDGSRQEEKLLDKLEQFPFKTLFVDGNHENFDRLMEYPIEEWHRGKVHFIRPHVIHLMRGQVFEIDGYTFFTMGGAQSHDIANGILDPAAPDFERQFFHMRRKGLRFRVNHQSWWELELPNDVEYEEAIRNLERNNYAVDYVVTHCAPSSIVDTLSSGGYGHDRLTDFLEKVKEKSRFHYWLFGHYHDNKIIDARHVLLWEQIVRIV